MVNGFTLAEVQDPTSANPLDYGVTKNLWICGLNMLYVLNACLHCMSMLHVHDATCSRCMSVPHVYAFCMSLLHVHAQLSRCTYVKGACQCCISNASCPCSVYTRRMSMLYDRAACPFQCWISMLHFLSACPCCMSVLHAHVNAARSCEGCMSMLHVMS
jgi:hypothetical protein